MNLKTVGLIGLSTILFILVVGLIVYNTMITLQRIDPKKCPQIKGSFGVQTRRVTSIVSKCGISGTDQCSFSNVDDLDAAITRCTILAEVCTSFTYSEITKHMNIVSNVSTAKGEDNMYTRQDVKQSVP